MVVRIFWKAALALAAFLGAGYAFGWFLYYIHYAKNRTSPRHLMYLVGGSGALLVVIGLLTFIAYLLFCAWGSLDQYYRTRYNELAERRPRKAR